MTPSPRRPEVRNTGAATASAGGVANTGWIDNLTVHSQPPAQSTYPALVRQIAPERLVGRDAALAELAAFCTEPAQIDNAASTGFAGGYCEIAGGSTVLLFELT